MIVWLIKEELANRNLSSLQALVDKVGANERLNDFGHCSSTAVSEMILLISEVVTEKIQGEITKYHLWSTMVDETSDISPFQQYITFVRYVVKAAGM